MIFHFIKFSETWDINYLVISLLLTITFLVILIILVFAFYRLPYSSIIIGIEKIGLEKDTDKDNIRLRKRNIWIRKKTKELKKENRKISLFLLVVLIVVSLSTLKEKIQTKE